MRLTTPKTLVRDLLLLFLLAGCGTLIGNPEDEDDTASVPDEIDNREIIDQEAVYEAPNVLQESSGQGPGPDEGGRVNFYLADAPVDDVTNVFVNVVSFQVKPEAGE